MTDKTTEKLAPCYMCDLPVVLKHHKSGIRGNAIAEDYGTPYPERFEISCRNKGHMVYVSKPTAERAIEEWNRYATRAAPSSDVGGAREALTGMEADLLAYLDHEYEYRDAYPSEAKKHANEYQLIKARTEIVKAALQSGVGVDVAALEQDAFIWYDRIFRNGLLMPTDRQVLSAYIGHLAANGYLTQKPSVATEYRNSSDKTPE